MKMHIFLYLVLIFSQNLSAEDFKIHVHSFDDDIDLKKIKSREIETNKGAGRYISQVSELPSIEEMDEQFKTAGFDHQLLKMDQMDKDLFYLKVQKRSIEYLIKKYPTFDIDSIKKLKKMIGDEN